MSLLILSSSDTSQVDSLLSSFSSSSLSTVDRKKLSELHNDPTKQTYDGLHVVISESDNFKSLVTVGLLTACFERLVPGGILNIHANQGSLTASELREVFDRASLYSGFITPQQLTSSPTQALFSHQLTCQRPHWTAQSSVARIDGVELVDEDSLLEGLEPYQPMAKGKADCSSKPRACANCTCGRAELEADVGAEEAKRRLEVGLVRSSCGNCYKGDAFRCAGCPYRGKPAFKGGDKVELDVDSSNLGQVDELGGMVETVEASLTAGGKLLIEI